MPKSGVHKTSNISPDVNTAEPLRADGAPITSYMLNASGDTITALADNVPGVVPAGRTGQYLGAGPSGLFWGAIETSQGEVLTTGETTVDRSDVLAPAVAPGTGVLQLAYFTAQVTEDITKLAGYTAGIAATVVTLARYGVYSVAQNGDLTLIASSATDTALFGTTNTRYQKTLSATWSKVAGTVYAVGALCLSTVSPTLAGKSSLTAAAFAGMYALAPRRSGQIGSLSDLPTTVAAASVADSGGIPYIEMLR